MTSLFKEISSTSSVFHWVKRIFPYLLMGGSYLYGYYTGYPLLYSSYIAVALGIVSFLFIHLVLKETTPHWTAGVAALPSRPWQLVLFTGKHDPHPPQALLRARYKIQALASEEPDEYHLLQLLDALGTKGVLHFSDSSDESFLSLTSAASPISTREELRLFLQSHQTIDVQFFYQLYDLVETEDGSYLVQPLELHLSS